MTGGCRIFKMCVVYLILSFDTREESRFKVSSAGLFFFFFSFLLFSFFFLCYYIHTLMKASMCSALSRRSFPVGQLLLKQFRWKYCLIDDGFAVFIYAHESPYVFRPSRRTVPVGQLLLKQFRWKYCLTDDGFAILIYAQESPYVLRPSRRTVPVDQLLLKRFWKYV